MKKFSKTINCVLSKCWLLGWEDSVFSAQSRSSCWEFHNYESLTFGTFESIIFNSLPSSVSYRNFLRDQDLSRSIGAT